MKDDETKIMSRIDLPDLELMISEVKRGEEIRVKEIGTDKIEIKKIKSEKRQIDDENKKNNSEKQYTGGMIKMRQRGGMGVTGAAALFFMGTGVGAYVTNWWVGKQIDEMKDNHQKVIAGYEKKLDEFPMVMARRAKLNKALDEQIESANAFLVKTNATEKGFEKFMMNKANRYFVSSIPSGELEQKAKEEVDSLKTLFNDYHPKKRRVGEMSEKCYTSSADLQEKREEVPFSEYKEGVYDVLGDYTTVFGALAQKLQGEIDGLNDLKEHTNRYPLKGSKELRGELEDVITKRKEVLKEVSEYIDVFEGDSQCQDELPVRIVDKQKQDNVASTVYGKQSM